jgi:hypothetical protein
MSGLPDGILTDNVLTEIGEDFSSLRTLPGLREIENWTIDADEGVCTLFTRT